MSTSLLYHAFGIRGYQYVGSRYEFGEVIFRIVKRKQDLVWPVCGSHKGTVERWFHSVPIGSKPVAIVLAVQRVLCLVCDSLRQIQLGFADPRRRYTRQFERYALDLSRCMTIKDVADHLKVSWDVIKDIQKRYLIRRFSKPKLKMLKHITIDEISIGKGHRYLTIVLNLHKGILALFDHRISTGPLEGTNNKIKTMKRQAYGFRDQEFFKLKIMALHRSRYAFVG